MKKGILLTVVGLMLLVGVLGGIKFMQFDKMGAAQGKQMAPPGIVTTAKVRSDTWETRVSAVGSLEAVQGVLVTAELMGKIVQIPFEPGSRVKAGTLLVQQDISLETAQLRAAEATASLAKINFQRSAKLLPDRVISRSDYDDNEAQLKQAEAQADTFRATIAKKTIRAPFDGRPDGLFGDGGAEGVGLGLGLFQLCFVVVVVGA